MLNYKNISSFLTEVNTGPKAKKAKKETKDKSKLLWTSKGTFLTKPPPTTLRVKSLGVQTATSVDRRIFGGYPTDASGSTSSMSRLVFIREYYEEDGGLLPGKMASLSRGTTQRQYKTS